MSAYGEGYTACMDGVSYRDNPYDVRVTEYTDWNLGFEGALAFAAQAETDQLNLENDR